MAKIKLSECKRCLLYKKRNKVVKGSGKANIPIVFLGEAPGKIENKTGRPFVGRSGKLLDTILNSANFKRKDVYISNVVKCRPNNNRKPFPNEIKICYRWLEKEMKRICPAVIVTLGVTALETLTGINTLKEVRGNFLLYSKYFCDNILYIMPTYHPSAALRNRVFKKKLKKDIMTLKDYWFSRKLPEVLTYDYFDSNSFLMSD